MSHAAHFPGPLLVIAPLIHALPLALGAAISPALVGVTIELLATGGSSRRIEVLAYLLGGTAALLGIGVLGLFVVPAILGPSSQRENLTIDVVDAGLGVALLVVASRLAIRRRRQSREPIGKLTRTTTADPATSRSRPRLVALGVVMMVTNVSTILLSIGALREIARAAIGPFGEAAALVLLVGVAMTPVWLPLGIDVVAPDASARVLTPISRVFDRHGTVIAASVSAISGIYLLVRSVTAF